LNVMDNTGDSRATVLILFEPKSAFEENWGESQVKNALRAGASKSSHIIFYGNRVDDIRIQSDVINTLQARMGTGGGNMPIVALQGNMIGRADTSGPQGKGYSDDEKMFTLTKTDIHAVAVDLYNATVNEDNFHTLRVGGSGADGTPNIMSESTVRRLTPVECERLQGFPDNWTEGQADTHRYKQMGNAVAVPVVSWLVNRLMEAASDLD
jgi:DNA (cytosine-5)-methyltransferase 1